MKTYIQLILVIFSAQTFLFGCGLLEKLEGHDSKKTETTDTAIKAPSSDKGTDKQPADTNEQEAAATLSVEGLPDLDVNIGKQLSDVEIEESQQFNKDAVKYYKKNDFDTAEPLFLKALKKNPSNLVFRYNLACVAALKGNKDKAIAILRQLKETPDCPRCFILLAKAVDDTDFDSIRADERFKSMVDGAPERLEAELKLSKWIQFDGKSGLIPIRTNGIPAITDDGKRIVVVNQFKKGYRMQILLASTGEVRNSIVLINPKELAQLKNDEISARELRPIIKQRIDKAHKALLGRNWLEFKIKSNTISPTWLRGTSQQRFQLGNSTITYRYPNLSVTNSKGRESYKGKIGDFPDDDCTKIVAISEAYVNGRFHVMLFRQHNATTVECDPQPGKYHVITIGE